MPYLLLVLSLFCIAFFSKRLLVCTWNFQQVKFGAIHPQLKNKYIPEAHQYIRFYAIMLAGSIAFLIVSIYSFFI